MDSGLFRGPWNSVPCVPAHFNHWPHGHPQDFFQGWAMRGSEGRKSPSRVQGQLPSGSLGATDDIFSEWCINTSSTEALDNSCSKKKHFSTFPGAGEVPPRPCLRAPMTGRTCYYCCYSSCCCCCVSCCRPDPDHMPPPGFDDMFM